VGCLVGCIPELVRPDVASRALFGLFGRPVGNSPALPFSATHIWIVALAILSKAFLHASAGGHFSVNPSNTDVPAQVVCSISSSDMWFLTAVECQIAYKNAIPDMNRWCVARYV
jgi:hypothetical protein